VTLSFSALAGLKDASISLDFHQDFGAASVDATLFPLLGSQATVVITPTNGNVEHVSRIRGRFLVHRVPTLRKSSVGDLSHAFRFLAVWPMARFLGALRKHEPHKPTH
jgi:hypothetical protein